MLRYGLLVLMPVLLLIGCFEPGRPTPTLPQAGTAVPAAKAGAKTAKTPILRAPGVPSKPLTEFEAWQAARAWFAREGAPGVKIAALSPPMDLAPATAELYRPVGGARAYYVSHSVSDTRDIRQRHIRQHILMFLGREPNEKPAVFGTYATQADIIKNEGDDWYRQHPLPPTPTKEAPEPAKKESRDTLGRN
jgi:hypothetical protein